MNLSYPNIRQHFFSSWASANRAYSYEANKQIQYIQISTKKSAAGLKNSTKTSWQKPVS